MESAVGALQLELVATDVQGAADIERAIDGFAGQADWSPMASILPISLGAQRPTSTAS
jgi:hypothetical protein